MITKEQKATLLETLLDINQPKFISLGASHPGIIDIAFQLEEEGLVALTDPIDGRNIHGWQIILTQKGRDFLNELAT